MIHIVSDWAFIDNIKLDFIYPCTEMIVVEIKGGFEQ